jgi:mannonate dehydratase
MLNLVPSSASALEFCLGSIAEMPDGDVYNAVENLAPRAAAGSG